MLSIVSNYLNNQSKFQFLMNQNQSNQQTSSQPSDPGPPQAEKQTTQQQQQEDKVVRIVAGTVTETSDYSRHSHHKGQGHRRSQATLVSSNTPQRVDPPEVSVDDQVGPVNIQSDAFSFEKQAMYAQTTQQQKLKKQRTNASMNSRSSKRSGQGGPALPPAVYGATQMQAHGKKSITSENATTLGHLRSEVNAQPERINALIQRDIAKQQQNTSMGDQSFLMPSQHNTSLGGGLLAPMGFPKLQKQATGRNDKQKLKNQQMLLQDQSVDSQFSGGALKPQPAIGIQRINTKVEKDSAGGENPNLLAISPGFSTNLNQISRPSNLSGGDPSSANSPIDAHDSNESQSEFIKPSVQLTQLDDQDQKVQAADLQSQKSFKVAGDTQTIVTVETQIQILDKNKQIEQTPKQNETDKQANITSNNQRFPQPKLPYVDQSTGAEVASRPPKPPQTAQQATAEASMANKLIQDKKKGFKMGLGAKSAITTVKESMISTRAQRDVFSQKSDALNISQDSQGKTDLLNVSVLSNKSILKNLQTGLVSIEENLQEQQPDIQIENLGENSIEGTAKDQSLGQSVQETVSVAYNNEDPEDETVYDGKSQKTIHDVISIRTTKTNPKKSAKKKKGKKADNEDIKEKAYEHDTREILKLQLFAQDFFDKCQDNVNTEELVTSTDPTGTNAILSSNDMSQPKASDVDGITSKTGTVQITSKDETETDPTASDQQFALLRQEAVQSKQPEADVVETQEVDRVRELEDQVQLLKDVLRRQKEFQDKVMDELSQNQARGGRGASNEPALVGNNSGYIGQIHQPVYNIKIYQGDLGSNHLRASSNSSHSQISQDSAQAMQLQQNFYVSNRPARPSSSNVYAAGAGQRAQTGDQHQSIKKKRPMTAAGVGNRAIKRSVANEPENNAFTGVQNQASAIDFQLQERPISAATYQKQIGRNQKAQVFFSEGQISDYRQRQEQMATLLHKLSINQSGMVPEAGQKARGSLKQLNEQMALEEMIRDGHTFFYPRTNMSSQTGIQRTKSCYTNAISQKRINPSTNYVQTQNGKTGYAAIPNKSQKILEKAMNDAVGPKTLSKTPPLGLKTEPMRSLKGPLYVEMVALNKLRNGEKKTPKKPQTKPANNPTSRHAKLKQQAEERRGGQLMKNEDLFFSPIDEFMKQNLAETPAVESQPSNKSENEAPEGEEDDSPLIRQDSVPGLTGNTHIMMERDFFQNKYSLTQNGKKLEMSEKHFHPIFFGKSANALRKNKESLAQLKKFDLFVNPNEKKVETKDDSMQRLGIGEKLEKIMKAKNEKDLAEYYKKQQKKLEANGQNLKGSKIKSNLPHTSSSKDQRQSSSQRHKIGYRMPRNTYFQSSNVLSPEEIQAAVARTTKNLNQPTSSFTFNDLENKKKPVELTEKQDNFFSRLAQNNEPKSRQQVLQERQARRKSAGKITKIIKGSIKQESPKQEKTRVPRKQMSSNLNNYPDSPSEVSGSVFSVYKGSPQQVKSAQARKFSFSAGGGTYPLNSTQALVNQTQKTNQLLKKSKTPKMKELNAKPDQTQRSVISKGQQEPIKEKSQGVFSNSTQTTKMVTRRPPKQHHQKSIMSAEPPKMHSSKNIQRIQTAGQQRKITSSSDKSKSVISGKTGTVTDRRTDGTGVALTKHIESKFSETQTNTESDITVVTKIAEKVPAKIKALEVIVPSLTQRLVESSLENEEKTVAGLKVKTQESESLFINRVDMRADGHQVSDADNKDAQLGNGDKRRNQDMAHLDFREHENSRNQRMLKIGTEDLKTPKVEASSPNLEVAKQVNSPINSEEDITPKVDFMQIKIGNEVLELAQANHSFSSDSKEQVLASDTHSSKLSQDLSRVDSKQIVIDRVQTSSQSPHSQDQAKEEMKIAAFKQKLMPNVLRPVASKPRTNSIEDISKIPQHVLLQELEINTSEKPNTDRKITTDQDIGAEVYSSPHIEKQEALAPPAMTSGKRPQREKLKNRQPTKDSMISVLTPNFYHQKHEKDTDKSSEIRRRSAVSDFSFAADLNRMVELKKDLHPDSPQNQSSLQMRDRNLTLLSPSSKSKRNEDSRTGSHLDAYSETTNDNHSSRLAGNIDLIELDAEDTNEEQVGVTSPKSVKLSAKPIFQISSKD